MRILVLHSRYLSGSLSGENRVVEAEAELLRARGHDVEVFAPSALGLPRRTLAARTLGSATVADAIRKRVRSEGIDVVHCHNLFPNLGPWVLPAAARGGAAVVMTLHNYRLTCLAGTLFRNGEICEDCLGKVPWRGIVHGCYRGSRTQSAVLASSITAARLQNGFSAVDRFLAISAFIRQKHIEAGLCPTRIVLKPNFVPAATQRDGPGSYFLILSRLSPEKGLDDVVASWTSDLGHLRIAGEGSERRRLERLATGRDIRFEGKIDPLRIEHLLRDARAVLMPSRWYEGQPRVVLEAYAAGVPVIVSRIGALQELVNENESGLTVPVGDLNGWSHAVRRLLSDEVSVRLGRHAYSTWREHFSPERACLLLENAYEEALEARVARVA